MVSVRLTVVPQIARISSGSSDGAAAAERFGADDMGRSRWVPSELRLLRSLRVEGVRRGLLADALGVILIEGWMSPRR